MQPQKEDNTEYYGTICFPTDGNTGEYIQSFQTLKPPQTVSLVDVRNLNLFPPAMIFLEGL